MEFFFFFFFQAEDGIRDFHVTGVQTCALPICRVGGDPGVGLRRPSPRGPAVAAHRRQAVTAAVLASSRAKVLRCLRSPTHPRKGTRMTRLLTSLLAAVLLATPVLAAEPDTLQKIKSSNTITLGYREDARPFAYTGDDGKPAGYSVELCTRIAATIARQLGLTNLQTKWVKVTPENRLTSVINGTIDLECGSTTASLTRQEQVDFSLMTFVDGGSLLVTDASGVRGIATLDGKKVGVVPGTTTEKALTMAIAKHGVKTTVVQVKNHEEGVAALDNHSIDAYASDRTLLIGMGRTSKSPEKLSLVDEYFSYEPHGFVLRRGDAAFRLAVNRSLASMYRSGEVAPIFEKYFGSMTTAGPLIVNMYLMNGLPE